MFLCACIFVSFILFTECVWLKINALIVVSVFKEDLFFSKYSEVMKSLVPVPISLLH